MAQSTVRQQLVKHIDEAHAMEQNVLRMLDGMISTTDDPEIIDRLEHHKLETQEHAIGDAAAARGARRDAVDRCGRRRACSSALMKMPLDLVRGEKAGRNARDGYATEHLEIASYQLLGASPNARATRRRRSRCREIIEQERAMATFIEENWDRFAELSLREQGIRSEAKTGRPRRPVGRTATRSISARERGSSRSHGSRAAARAGPARSCPPPRRASASSRSRSARTRSGRSFSSTR